MGRHIDDDGDGVADWSGDNLGDRRLGQAAPAEGLWERARATFLPRAITGPVIYGVDVHTKYQAGLDIEQVAREGFTWLTVKVSQGTSATWAVAADDWLRRGEAAGMVVFGYHYLTTADVAAQARTAREAARGRPIMVDVEDGSGTVDNLRRFLAACAAEGVRIPLVYLPRWYWQKIGSPSLAGLPPIVSSRYRVATGYASAIYAGVPDTWWDSYGGGDVRVLQFSDRTTVAGKQVDANAFRGTRDQFAALIGAAAPPPPPPPPGPGGTYPVLHEGDVSDLVWRLQKFLVRVFPSYARIDVGPGPTGRLGPQTVATVEEFQRRSGIPVTPPFAVGPKTWAALTKAGFR